MNVAVLASGSKGNASFYETKGTRVLIDAGLGPRSLMQQMEACHAGSPHRLDAIVITHAHQDHVGHAEKLALKFSIPVYMSEATARAVSMSGQVIVRRFSPREAFAIGKLLLSPIPLPHDAAQVAFVVSDGQHKAALVTDLGEVPPALVEHIDHCDVVLLESNHDVDMLKSGPYPDFLKRRVLSSRGHLSNLQTHSLLSKLSTKTHTVVLMHLSETNNHPKLALEVARDALRERAVRLKAAAPRETLRIECGLQQSSQMTLWE